MRIGHIENGIVLDHITAGNGMNIYNVLKLDKLDCCVAIIKNARSNAMGKKDILKVECDVDALNLDVIAPVYQPVPGKGNFFLEPLAKTGAGEKYQLFGQLGLDHGPEWYHGKFTGIATTFTAPTYSRSVYVANASEIGAGA